MKFRILCVVIFILSLIMTVYYANSSLISFENVTLENVPISGGAAAIEKQVVRTYYENYGAIGGAIAFSILAGASLISFAKSRNSDS